MKKVTFTLYFVSSLFISSLVAQPCGNSGSSACIPSGQFIGGGFEEPSSAPCAEQGIAYSHSIQFTMYSSFTFPGVGTVVVDSVQFVKIDSLPCGLCWATNNPNNLFVADESGCIKISGTTSDPTGQYKLALTLNAWIQGTPTAVPVGPSLVNQTPIRMIVRVKAPAGVCVNADTAASAPSQSPSATCPSGINDVAADFSSVELAPNPLTSNGHLTFVSEKNTTFTITVTDITGKTITSRKAEARKGENSVLMERNGLPAGTYFLLLSDEKHTLPIRFSVME